jgi:hypothetical protein
VQIESASFPSLVRAVRTTCSGHDTPSEVRNRCRRDSTILTESVLKKRVRKYRCYSAGFTTPIPDTCSAGLTLLDVKNMNYYTPYIQLSPSASYILLLISKHSPQHFVLERRQSTFLAWDGRPRPTPMKTAGEMKILQRNNGIHIVTGISDYRRGLHW